MKGFMDLLKERKAQLFSDASPPEMEGPPPAEYDDPDAAHGFTIALKKKRRTAMLKNMLVDAGYTDLAKMINVKET